MKSNESKAYFSHGADCNYLNLQGMDFMEKNNNEASTR